MSAICVIGTALPLRDGIARSLRNDSRARSAGAPRSSDLDLLVALAERSVTERPDTALLRNAARSCDEMPSTRALFWSIASRITLDGSSQSNCTLRRVGIACA